MTNDYSSKTLLREAHAGNPLSRQARRCRGFPRREPLLLLTSWVYDPDYYAVGLRPRLGGYATISLVLSGSVLGLTLDSLKSRETSMLRERYSLDRSRLTTDKHRTLYCVYPQIKRRSSI